MSECLEKFLKVKNRNKYMKKKKTTNRQKKKQTKSNK